MKVKPFLSWAGGKTNLLKYIYPHFPKQFNHYYEPFLGGGAVFLGMPWKKKATLSDMDGRLIECYHQIKYNPVEVINHLYNLDEEKSRKSNQFFYEVKGRLAESSEERAANFIFLSRHSFASIMTRKSSTMPDLLPAYRKKWFNPKEIMRASQKLQDVDIFSLPYETISPTIGDFVYIDPPYYLNSKDIYTHGNEFVGLSTQVTLCEWIKSLDRGGVMFLMSNTWHDHLLNLYKDFKCYNLYKDYNSRRRFLDETNKRSELIVKNY